MVKEKYKGVEYNEGPDMAKGYMLGKAKEIYEELNSDYLVDSLNEAIELYTIDKYVKDGLFLQYVGEDKEDWLREKNRIANKSFGRYIGSHLAILSEYKNLNFRNREMFWEVVGERRLSCINDNDLKQVLNAQEHFVWQIFRQKKVVMRFDATLRDYMMDNPEGSTNIILNKYLINHIVEKQKSYLPASLTLVDKEKIISDYLDIENLNLNYTRLISQVQSSTEFALDARTKLKAKRVSKKLENEIFNNDNNKELKLLLSLEMVLRGQ